MAKRVEKRSLRPVQDVLARILHDPTFDASQFVIGYDDRFSEVREAPLVDFLGGGEVPWHRIQSIRAGSLRVWDRRERLDLVFGSGASEATDHPAILQACATTSAPTKPAASGRERGKSSAPALRLTPRTCWHHTPERGWVPASPEPVVAIESLHVATFNLLFDRHEADKIYGERRRPAALELLRELEADLIALQEVTPTSLAAILAAPWVRERYCVSSGPAAEGVDPYGVVLLSRWPLVLTEHRFSAEKALLFGRLELAGRPLLCVALHLTSDRSDEGGERRAEQLAALAGCLDELAVPDVLVLGDLNFDDSDDPRRRSASQRVAACGLVDVWPQLHPHEPGFTFDPAQNPLAALMSRRGRAARLDRVLVRAPTGAIEPVEIVRFGDRPFASEQGEDLYASDHFGLSALLEVRAGAVTTIDDDPVHTSALVIVPPMRSWPAIQAIRSELDPSYGRWMPHVNLIYGFVPEARFAAAAAAIAAVLREHPTLDLRFGELRRFDHRSATTLWVALEGDPPDALRKLQATLQTLFPACREQAERGAAGFTAHLTIAKVRGTEAERAATLERLRPRIPTGTWTVDAVHLISRREAEPFVIRRSVALAWAGRGPLVVPPITAAWPSSAHAELASTIAAACVEALGAGARVHVVGSIRLGVAAADADLDLLCVHTEAVDDPLARVAAALAHRGPVVIRTARGGGILALRGELAGIDFDLLFAHVGASWIERDWAQLDADDLRGLDEASRRALLGCIDADALVRLARTSAGTFCGALVHVRTWARARALEGGAWGLLGGFTWAILVAVAAREAPETLDAWGLVRRFFTMFAAWPAGQPVISGASPPVSPPVSPSRSPWPIYTPTAPAFNSARGLMASTHALVRRELARAAELVNAAVDEASGLASLCTAAAVEDPLVLELGVIAESPADLAEAKGVIDGRALGLLRALESAGAQPWPRAWAHADLRARVVVGLRGGDQTLIAQALERFVAELRSAADWPAGTEVRGMIVPNSD